MNARWRFPLPVMAIILLSAARTQAVDLDRADYKISLPDGSTIEKSDGEVDADHLTTVNLPNGGTMVIVVIDDKERASAAFTRMRDEYKSKLKDGDVGKSESFVQPKATRSATVTGKLNGLTFTFDLGQIDGKQKAVIVVFTYMQSKKADTIEMVRKALTTFAIKE